MLENIKYVNHMNESVEFGKGGIYANINELRDYSWDINKVNNRISSFTRGVTSSKLPVVIKASSEAEGVSIKNRICDVFEKDILTQEYGKLIIGDYYLKCYITASTKKSYLTKKDYIQLTLTVKTDIPYWIKEESTMFGGNSATETAYLDYPYDYEYDFRNTLSSDTLFNSNILESDFIITVYGYINHPVIYINDHKYDVDVDVETGDYLTIDSKSKTIILNKFDGTKENCFNARNKDSYIFQKIAMGANTISTDNDFLYSITLITERSEPEWT